MSTVTSNELISTVNSLRDSSPGYNVSVRVLKSIVSIPILSSALQHLCNMSFSMGIFPNDLKTAKIIPIYKSGDKKLFNNHRPISILPAISKVIEKIMYNRIIEFFNERKILTDAQYGFRGGRSTETALTTFKTDILQAFDKQEYSISLFLDLSKAFDTVNHQILLTKLEHYGIRNTTYRWFESYLTSRKQFVQYSDKKFNTLAISLGMPQGSNMGPLLFILYINDMVNCSRALKTILFADDTTLYASHRDINTLIHMVNNELDKVQNCGQLIN